MTNFRTNTETIRNKTYRFSDDLGRVVFYIETDLYTYRDGSVVTEKKFCREDYREYTNPSRRYQEFKNEKSFNSTMSRMIKEGLEKIS